MKMVRSSDKNQYVYPNMKHPYKDGETETERKLFIGCYCSSRLGFALPLGLHMYY